MLNIKVLGPGCANCERVTQMVATTLEELEAELGDNCPEATLQKVTDHEEFLEYGVLTTPGLVINEKVVCTGRVPTKAEVRQWLTSFRQAQDSAAVAETRT
ncbi:MAG TPA: thioredoxin family protein [Anaerolineae bacterium]|nr:thioredoxin family protein [Anaerolineae bacterium]